MTCCTAGCGNLANHRITVDRVVLMLCVVCVANVENRMGEETPTVIQLPHSIPIAIR